MAKMGRPTKYSQELADRFCDKIAQGNSMRKVVKLRSMPSGQTIFSWFRTYPDFLEQYTRAKEESADYDHDRLDEIAEGVLDETYDPQRAKVASDIIKWSASKKKPKKYGDRVFNETTHKGIIGMRDVSDMSNEELETELKQSEDTR